MAGLITPNFNDVPDTIPPVGAGVRKFIVKDAKVEPDRFEPDKHTQLGLQLAVNDNGPEQGRVFFDQMRLTGDDPRGRVKAKNFLQSTGAELDSSGAPKGEVQNPDGTRSWPLVVNKIGLALVQHKSGKQNPTQQFANVVKYFIPGEPEFESNK